MRKSLAIGCLAVLASCALGPNFEKPEIKSPENFRYVDTVNDQLIDKKWWLSFGDKTLNKLMDIGLKNNLDIQIAVSRIEEARLFYGFTKKDLLPLFGLSGGATRGDFSGGVNTGVVGENLFISSTMSWEIDFWGKLRRANEGAKNRFLAQAFAYETVRLQLTSDIATAYFQLLNLDESLRISKETVKSRQESYRIIRARFRKGTVPEIDLNQAAAQLAIAEAAVPQYERFITEAENLLRILLGQNPGKVYRPIDGADRIIDPPMIPVGVPSTVLQRRPDVASAQRLLQAENADIGVAVASMFPTISLTGAAGFASADLSKLGSDLVWNLGANLVGPLFQWGKNLDNVDIQKEQMKQSLLSYRKTVITAFQDVENSLRGLETYKREVKIFDKQVKALRNAAKLSMARYNSGVTSYLEVLESERSLFDAEINYLSKRQQELASYVRVYKSLGGGWELEEKEKEVAKEVVEDKVEKK